jgi:hypothetical protein
MVPGGNLPFACYHCEGGVDLLGAREGVVIIGMAVSIEDRIDLIESARRNVLVAVALFEKLSYAANCSGAVPSAPE